MTHNPWAELQVTAVAPGATYESETFDQYITAVTPDGTTVELFDMNPMIAAELAPGAKFQALIAVDAHTGLLVGQGDTAVVTGSIGLERVDLPTVRAEVFDRGWALVSHRGIPMLIATERLSGAADGSRVTWREAVLYLMGWRAS